MNLEDKILLLKDDIHFLCTQVAENQKSNWGKMNAWQMLEHVALFFQLSSGKISYDIVTPEADLPKYRSFLLSDKPFRENTLAPEGIIPLEPLPVTQPTFAEAIRQLDADAFGFFSFFHTFQGTTNHPVFGPLNFEDWVALHSKHLTHHRRQFESRNELRV